MRNTIGHTAGSVADRVLALHDFYLDPSVHGILAFWGGANSHQLLEHLDFKLIRQHPKPLIGYSDLTALQNGIFTKSGLISYSGPAVISFCKPIVPDFTWKHFQSAVIDGAWPITVRPAERACTNLDWKKETMRFKPSKGWRVFRRGEAKGRIQGGHLGTLLLLAGTPYWPPMKGVILFAEYTGDEPPEILDRYFTQLRHMGVYDEIAGLVVGRSEKSPQWTPNDTLEMILEGALKGYGFPVMTEVDFGHTDPIFTFPVGGQCALSTSKKQMIFTLR